MLTLGIETSGRSGAVALCRDGDVLVERPLEQAGRRHAQTLVAEIDRLFAEFGLSPRDCQLVAVSLGPGSFTGLRVGVVCAKTFAWAVGCPLAGVETFACIAEHSPAEVREMFVTGDAQRGELFVGRYLREENGLFVREGEIAIVPGEPWCRQRAAGDVVSGPGVERFEPLLAERCRVLAPDDRLPRAAIVARLGERQVESGIADDPYVLEPFYLRKSAAEEKWDAARGGMRDEG